ncbi:MAG: inorganic phosphate transporter [Phycisphaeraceae bacterium]
MERVMSWILSFSLLIMLLLAFANGANDNAKGVATLVGCRYFSMDRALVFAGVMTLLGALSAVLLAGELARRFSGKGIVDPSLLANSAFPICVGLGASLTVLLATVVGLPISTTHALVGAIVGVGWTAGSLHVSSAVNVFFVPLLVSPMIAIVLAGGVYSVFRVVRMKLGVERQTCLCVGHEIQPVLVSSDGLMSIKSSGMRMSAGQAGQCRDRYVGRFLGLEAQSILNGAHLISAGAVSFGRGLNDTPKIAAVMITAGIVSGTGGVSFANPTLALILTGLGIALGGLLAVRRVARTMSDRITEMNDGQGFSANLSTALLVLVASRFGLPVSTTHVSCGSLFGIGLINKRACWPMIGRVVLAWVTTLPVAAALAGLFWVLLGGRV